MMDIYQDLLYVGDVSRFIYDDVSSYYMMVMYQDLLYDDVSSYYMMVMYQDLLYDGYISRFII